MNIDRIYVDSELYDIYKDNDKIYLRLEKLIIIIIMIVKIYLLLR